MAFYVIKEGAVQSVGASLVAVAALTLTTTMTSWLSEAYFAIGVIALCLNGLLRLGLEVRRNILKNPPFKLRINIKGRI